MLGSYSHGVDKDAAQNAATARVIADNVRRLRRERGLTQEELAELAGLSSVGMIEAPQAGRSPPRTSTLQKIATALGVGIEELYRDEAGVQTTSTLDDFLGSPVAPADITAQEIAELRRFKLPFGTPTAATWFHLLQAMRSAKTNGGK